MQAFYFFAIFGMLSAIIGGIIAVSNLTTQRLRVMLLNEAHEQFRNANVMLNGQYIPNYLQSPPIPGGGTSTPAGPYICSIEDIRQILNCSGGVPKDPWNHDVTGVVVRQMQAIATKNNLVFNVPVTGYALLSAGPDGIVQTTLPANPTSIAQLTALTASDDDILEVFTDQKGQQDNVRHIETAMSRIGQAATENYQRQFALIVKPNLAGIYAAANFSDVTTPAAQNYWKTYVSGSGAKVDFHKLLNPDGTLNTYAIGDDGDVATIQRTLGDGANLTLLGSVSNSDSANNGINDILFLTISTTTTPWQQVTANCAVNTPTNCMKVKGTI